MAEFQASGERMREAAKWLVAIFGAIAGILIAGTQLSSIGSLPVGTRLFFAIAGASVALVGVLCVVWLLLGIMLPSHVALDEVAYDLTDCTKKKPLPSFLRSNPSVLLPYNSLGHLLGANKIAIKSKDSALRKYYQALKSCGDETNSAVEKRETIAKAATAQAAQVDRDIGYVAKLLTVVQLRSRFGTVPKIGAFLGASLAAIGIGVFAWAANPPEEETAPGLALAGATLSGAGLAGVEMANADLTGAVLDGANLVGANLNGADLTNADLTGADIRGTSLDGVTWSNTTCPDGTNSDDHKSTCEGFLG